MQPATCTLTFILEHVHTVHMQMQMKMKIQTQRTHPHLQSAICKRKLQTAMYNPQFVICYLQLVNCKLQSAIFTPLLLQSLQSLQSGNCINVSLQSTIYNFQSAAGVLHLTMLCWSHACLKNRAHSVAARGSS